MKSCTVTGIFNKFNEKFDNGVLHIIIGMLKWREVLFCNPRERISYVTKADSSVFIAAYKTVSGVNGPLVILDHVKVIPLS